MTATTLSNGGPTRNRVGAVALSLTGHTLVAAARHPVVTLAGFFTTAIATVITRSTAVAIIGIIITMMPPMIAGTASLTHWGTQAPAVVRACRQVAWVATWWANWPHLSKEFGLGRVNWRGAWKPVWAWARPTSTGVRIWLGTPRNMGRPDVEIAVSRIAVRLGPGSWATVPSRVVGVVGFRIAMIDALATVTKAPPTTGLTVEVGTTAHGDPVVIDLTQPQHVAIQGMTRSGKSSLAYGLLSALAGRRDAIVCGVDPSGILLTPWLTHQGRDMIATGTADIAAHLQALTAIVDEMDDRIAHLVMTRRDVLPISTDHPALVVVAEEYPGLITAAAMADKQHTPNRKNAVMIASALGRLVKEGAKVGVRVILLAQRMSAKAVDTDDRANFATRITLRVDNGDAIAMLHDGIDRTTVATAATWPPGVGIVETPELGRTMWRAHHTSHGEYLAAVSTECIPGEVVEIRRPNDENGPLTCEDGEAA